MASDPVRRHLDKITLDFQSGLDDLGRFDGFESGDVEMLEFPVSGVETYWWVPIISAFLISVVTSPAGLSGAFVLLPFQVSVLGYATPGVTPTNLLFNIFAIPAGVYRYYREKRMVWPLVITIAAATLPGLLLGVIIRVKYLPDPGIFKLFVGLVLLYIASRLLPDILRPEHTAQCAPGNNGRFEVTPLLFNIREIAYEFNGVHYRVSTMAVFFLSSVVGLIGGIYGIGGGAIIAPFLVTFFKLPVHTISGAALCGTFLNSTLGVLLYFLVAPAISDNADAVRPDLLLGLLFGIGGTIGIYIGARLQRYLPARLIKFILLLIMTFVGGKYVISYF